MKVALVFLFIGLGEGLIICDWLHSRTLLNQNKEVKHAKTISKART